MRCLALSCSVPNFHLVTRESFSGFRDRLGSGSSRIQYDSARNCPVCVGDTRPQPRSAATRCLASVWAQHPHGPTEVIVVDDHSTDDTAGGGGLARGARASATPRTGAPRQARNTAIAAADCEWLAFLDSDDEWLPHHLAHLWEIKGEHALVGGARLLLHQ